MGRPAKYTSPKVLGEAINEYFDKPTISGLALSLGFCDRYYFYEYEKKPEFTYTIKKARACMTEYYESNVFKNTAGAIFMLKILGYTDKTEHEHSGNVSINPIQWADDE